MSSRALPVAFSGLLWLAGSITGFADESRFTRITSEWREPVYRQYDFWIGVGHANWRTRKPDEFFHVDVGTMATHWVYPTLNGKALLEFAMSDAPINASGARVQGFSVRYFDPDKQRWVMAQEWPDPNTTGGVADQLQGFYRFGRIQVFSTYYRGEPETERTRRYTFSDIRPEGFLWHGVSTPDRGATWSAGTLVEFSRLEAEAEWPRPGEPFPNHDNASQCTEEAYRAFDALAGAWHGTVSTPEGEREAKLTGYLMLGGCAVLSYLEFEHEGKPYTQLEVRSPSRDRSEWWVYQLDSLHDTAHGYQIGAFEDGSITLFDNNHFVIEDELKNLTPEKMPRRHDEALKKTVWTVLGDDELSFAWWTRTAADAQWVQAAKFSFGRR